jgi:hypothetical protein
MKPVYFPQTYLPPAVADALQALFPSVVVYQPVAGRLPDEMRPLAEKGFLEVMAPPPGDEADFDRLMQEFEQWGRLHQGGAGLRTVILHGRSFSETSPADGSPAEIVSAIRRRLAPEPPSRDNEVALMARAFLHLAQTADQQGFQMAGDLARYEKARTRLCDVLKGAADSDGSEFGSGGMTPLAGSWEDRPDLRLVAWTRLFSRHPYPSPVFVTHSHAVIRQLAAKVSGRVRLGFAELAPALQRLDYKNPPPAGGIMPQLDVLAAARLYGPEVLNASANKKSMEESSAEPCVHLWPEIHPRRFFDLALSPGQSAPNPPPTQSPWRNTVVVQMP